MADKRDPMTLLSLGKEDRQLLLDLAAREGCSITEYVRRMVRMQHEKTFKANGDSQPEQ